MRDFLLGMVVGALAVGAVGYTVQTERFPQFENPTVKVWRTVIAPGVPTDLHRHDHPRVVVALSGGPMEFIDDKGVRDRRVWETGKAYWLEAMPPGAMHRDVNAGEKPVTVMVMELEKEHNQP